MCRAAILEKGRIVTTRIPFINAALATPRGAATASADQGRVISSTPVAARLAVPAQRCVDQPQSVQPRAGGAGAVIVGVVGHGVGAGFSRAAATGLGASAGSAIADRTEAASAAPLETTWRNGTSTTPYQRRPDGDDVADEHIGQHSQARLAPDPGRQFAWKLRAWPQADAVSVAPAWARPLTSVAPVSSCSSVCPSPYGPSDSPCADFGPLKPRASVVMGGRNRRHGC